MIKQKKKICNGCEKETYLWNSKLKLCKYCFMKSKSSESNTKSNSTIKVKKKEPSGQYKMFQEIWEEREHVSQISGLPLVGPEHSRWVSQFEHILGKGPFPGWKLNKINIMLMTEQEHFDLTNNTHKCMQDPMYDEYFKVKQELREKYNDEFKIIK